MKKKMIVLFTLLLSILFNACSLSNDVENSMDTKDMAEKAITNVTYLYSATNGAHSTIESWGSGSWIQELYGFDGYSKVNEVKSGNGWGGWTSVISFMNLGSFQSNYDTITFKIKSNNLSSVFVKIPSSDPNYAGQNYVISSGRALSNGWYELTVPFSSIKQALPNQKEIGIHSGWGNGGSFYITDVFLSSSSTTSTTNYSLVWSDEFNGSGLPDATKWSFDVKPPGWVNQELQAYTDRRLENARMENGKLIIEARKDYYNGNPYSSARIKSAAKGDWVYGKVVVRAKLPKGRGVWPAIWMMPTDNAYGQWPNSGEIDIMEYVGHEPGKIHASMHSKNMNFTNGLMRTSSIYIANVENDFHDYILEWDANKITISVDSQVVGSWSKKSTDTWENWPWDKRYHLILNLAVGGSWGGQQGVDDSIWPQRLEVDYVRVYQKK